jgi:salicylate hydroxylase
VPVKKAERDPSVKSLLDKIGLNRTSVFTTTADERMIIYPCRSGTLLNCAVLIPASDADDAAARETSWLTVGSLEDLVARLGGFDPAIQELGKMAEDLKLWSLVTRDPPPTFVKGKLALLGDAAHPMLPRKCFFFFSSLSASCC